MKKVFCLAVATLLFASTPTFAGEGEAKKCDEKVCTETAGLKGCAISAALANLPALTFLVADKEVCCEASAGKLAEESDGKVQYLVAKKTYDDKNEAMVALADATEKFVSDFATPHTCSVSGETTVAGTSTSCSKSAGKLASITKEAMAGVSLVYKVGDEQCSCPNKAAALAKSEGKEQQFVIGDETTTCSVDARIKLARAKYEAAVRALAKAQATEEAPKS